MPIPIEDVAHEDDDASSGINTGIGVVIPAKMILETLYQDDLNEERELLLHEYRKQGATPDDQN